MLKALAAATLLLSLWGASPPSQAASIYGETDKLIRAGRAVQALGPDLFDSVTDPNNHTTYYGCDAMGRLSRVTYPGADTVAWADTALSFGPVGTDEYGLGAGHRRQTITTGSGLTGEPLRRQRSGSGSKRLLND